MAYADVLVTAEVNILAGFYVGCFGCNTVGRQIPTCISSVAYFFQLAYVYSVSIGFACCYAADLAILVNGNLVVKLNAAICKANAACAFTCADDGFDILQLIFQLYFYISTIIAYFDIVVTAEVNILAGFYVGCFGCNTVSGQVPAFICICSYLFDFFQLAYIYSISIINACSYVSDYFIVSIQAIFGNVSRATKANAHIIIHEEVTSMNAVNIKVSVQVNLNKGSILVFFLAYGNIFIVTAEVNILAGFYVGCFGCNTVGRQIPTLVGSFFYSVQLAYVYSVSIGSTCCYIDNLTFSTFTAYGYCISSVSYTAGTQSNAAFCTYASTVADSNCITSRNRILMTEGNNIASVTDCVIVAHYNRIGNFT